MVGHLDAGELAIEVPAPAEHHHRLSSLGSSSCPSGPDVPAGRMGQSQGAPRPLWRGRPMGLGRGGSGHGCPRLRA